MKRFYVLGCSFTNYAWPTWADIVGLEFDEWENWAFPGLGNRAIAERLAELHARNHLTKDDTVIIQWTSHLRHDWHANDTRHQDNAGWKTSGSLFNYINQSIFDDDWVKTFWSETSYMMHTYNNILLAQNFLNGIGCTWRMTSMGYINKMNSDYPNDEHGEQIPEIDAFTDVPNLSIYKKIFDDKSKWITPVGTFAWNHKTKPYKFKSMHDKTVFSVDRHPTLEQYIDYTNTQVFPSLNISQKQTKKLDYWIDTVNDAYETCHREFDNFCKTLDTKITDRKNYYRGF